MSSRKPLVAGNWKMHLTAAQGVSLVQNIDDFCRELKADVEVVVAPPFTAIHSASTVIDIDRMQLGLAAQNMHWEAEGAFTGEISPTMLTAARVGYVILGHSERREHFFETDEVINKKVKSAISHGISPILCCGESLDIRESGETLAFIEGQIRAGLEDVSAARATGIVIAYEPIWAIGTGKTATPKMAEEVCEHIRNILGDIFGTTIKANTRILYGGSVKAENAALFFAEKNIDGALVGGAALTAGAFNPIIAAAKT
ncbi:MAG: triose-phosphate isomerase [Coriobacteriia bacterium]|nr:triose-phosphate isomerase [Coriobacteriia bacterium]MCL2870752.1 triose-phosphate isomerase [Coriobacteriia bacterium]